MESFRNLFFKNLPRVSEELQIIQENDEEKANKCSKFEWNVFKIEALEFGNFQLFQMQSHTF